MAINFSLQPLSEEIMAMDAYIIVEAGTGYMDGIYYDLEMAEGALEGWRAQSPHNCYVLCQIMQMTGKSDWTIPDNIWLAEQASERVAHHG
jgi:hypothetical protein